ncbi:hypothetical protein ABNF07_00300 [Paenibacillus larvae]
MFLRKTLVLAAVGAALLGGFAVEGANAQDLSSKSTSSNMATLGTPNVVHIPEGSSYQLVYDEGYEYFFTERNKGEWSVSYKGKVQNFTSGSVYIDVYNRNGYLVAQYEIHTY